MHKQKSIIFSRNSTNWLTAYELIIQLAKLSVHFERETNASIYQFYELCKNALFREIGNSFILSLNMCCGFFMILQNLFPFDFILFYFICPINDHWNFSDKKFKRSIESILTKYCSNACRLNNCVHKKNAFLSKNITVIIF